MNTVALKKCTVSFLRILVVGVVVTILNHLSIEVVGDDVAVSWFGKEFFHQSVYPDNIGVVPIMIGRWHWRGR